MSKYTTEVRFICEQYSGLHESVGLSGVDMVIERARPMIFDFDYPIFDEKYRSVLETKILKHYYTKEIGGETVGLWKLWLNTRLNEIMPYYNKLYESELLDFNPLYEVDYTREYTRTDDEQKTDSNTTRTQTDIDDTAQTERELHDYFSDTPQGSVSNLEDLKYLTNATIQNESNTNTVKGKTVNEGTMTGTTNLNNTSDYLEHVRGKQGGKSYAKMLQEYRSTFLNIDMQVIDELKDLFMNLW